MKNVYFSLIFGSVFLSPIILILYSEGEIVLSETPLYLLYGILATYLLRMFSVLLEKSSKAGARFSERLVSGDKESNSEEEIPDKPEENYLQMLLGLYFVGQFLTSAFAAIPATLLIIPVVSILSDQYQVPVILIGGSIVSAIWLHLVKKWWHVKITLPYIPIPLLWMTPFSFTFGVIELLK